MPFAKRLAMIHGGPRYGVRFILIEGDNDSSVMPAALNVAVHLTGKQP